MKINNIFLLLILLNSYIHSMDTHHAVGDDVHGHEDTGSLLKQNHVLLKELMHVNIVHTKSHAKFCDWVVESENLVHTKLNALLKNQKVASNALEKGRLALGYVTNLDPKTLLLLQSLDCDAAQLELLLKDKELLRELLPVLNIAGEIVGTANPRYSWNARLYANLCVYAADVKKFDPQLSQDTVSLCKRFVRIKEIKSGSVREKVQIFEDGVVKVQPKSKRNSIISIQQ